MQRLSKVLLCPAVEAVLRLVAKQDRRLVLTWA
jgi:hypothetical protein